MRIHKEGYKILLYLLLVLTATNVLLNLALPMPEALTYLLLAISIVVFLLFLQFFRSPKVVVSPDQQVILAPANGKVVVIEKATMDEYINEERIQVSIFMSPLDVHINRNPVSGILKYFKYHPGKYLVAWHPKASTLNEMTTLAYEMDNGIILPIRQIAGAVARRIKCYIGVGDRVQQGEEFGFIRFGSRVDVFVPLSWKVSVNVGEQVKAGLSILARADR
jgi:phosphatidylserine decarboxylase